MSRLKVNNLQTRSQQCADEKVLTTAKCLMKVEQLDANPRLVRGFAYLVDFRE